MMRAGAAECLGRLLARSVVRSVFRSAANRAFNVASLFAPFSPFAPLPSSLSAVRCLLSVYRGRKRSLVGRSLWSVGRMVLRPFVRRASPCPFRDLGSFSLDRRTNANVVARGISPQTNRVAFPFEMSASKAILTCLKTAILSLQACK